MFWQVLKQTWKAEKAKKVLSFEWMDKTSFYSIKLVSKMKRMHIRNMLCSCLFLFLQRHTSLLEKS